MRTHPLAGFTVGVTAGRRADEQIALLSGRGADCLHGPCVVARVVPADDDLRSQLDAIIDNPPDITVLTTGLGVHTLFDGAEAHGLGDALRSAIGSGQVVAGGPQAVGEAIVAGLDVSWSASSSNAIELLDWLGGSDVRGQRILVQSDGEAESPYREPCEEAGAEVTTIHPYVWDIPEDRKQAERLIEAVADRRLDAVTFTTGPAVANFVSIAGDMDLFDEVVAACRDDVMLVAIGPVSSAAVSVLGLGQSVQPPRWRLGSMVGLMTSAFMDRALDLRSPVGTVRLQGCQLWLPGRAEPIVLTRRERAIIESLARRPGVVRSKRDLLNEVWGQVESDEHVVEVNVARLRKRLGPASSLIETVKRRGYRLWIDGMATSLLKPQVLDVAAIPAR